MELSPQQNVYYIDTVSPIDYFIDMVTLSAIQLNKEKIMSIELDGPLYLGSNSLQQQVDQNTEDVSELQSDVSSVKGDIGSLDNLATSDKSSLVNAINETLSVLDPTQTADYIKNSKSLKSGEISTNASILPWIKEMSHSTFDLSKFTVVGSPIVTTDGIASGFTTSNYLKTSIQLSALAGKSWRIEDNFTVAGNLIDYTLNLSEDLQGFGNITVSNYGLYFSYYIGDASDYDFGTVSLSPIPNGTYKYFLEFDITTSLYTLGYSNLDGSDIHTLTITPTKANKELFTINTRPNQHIMIGNRLDYAAALPTDLKQLSITSNGALIFSGNKTGIDTIKPDNYTVVGSPTISADGIVTGASGAYLSSPNAINLADADNWEIKFRSSSGTSGGGINPTAFSISTGDVNGIMLDAGTLYISGGNGWDISSDGIIPQDGNMYYIKLGFTGTQYYAKRSTDGINYTTIWTNSTTTKTNANSNLMLLNWTYNISLRYFNGNFDLNAFQIYINGSLVYQPCLKIPYTESKTGSKIADSVYRDRVIDMYNQFGYAPYYTLSDTDFTLPQGELYGLIGQRTLRDSYRNGISYWELYSNRDLEQGGSCTSGVEVTFARPFANINYVLSVPYSAKSSTTFTPTQTGDWIAKGKGLL